MKESIWLFCLGLLSLSLFPCNTRSACAILPGKTFEGNGVMLVDGGDTQDGRSNVFFFPVCQLDTANLLRSLTHATKGIMLEVDHQKWVRAFRKRGLTLIKSDTLLPRPFRRVYLTSVHVAFTDTMGMNDDANRQTFNFKLHTDKINCEQEVILLNHTSLRVNSFSGI